jgi:hypothetical protein
MREPMPRRASIDDAENTVPSAPRVARPRRKRIVTEESTEAAVLSTPEVREEQVVETPAPRPRRKAPTRRVAETVEPEITTTEPTRSSRRSKGSRVPTIVVVLVLLSAIGISAALGFADKGTIDVAAKLQEQGQIQANIAGEQSGTASQVVPVQNTPVSVPNGGLQGRGIDSGAAPAPVVQSDATTTATSSLSTASTTEATNESAEDTETPDSEASPSDTESAPAQATPVE